MDSGREEIQRLLREAQMAVGTPLRGSIESTGASSDRDNADAGASVGVGAGGADTPYASGGRGAYKELASLIGSLDLDIKTPVRATSAAGAGAGAGATGDVEDFSVMRFGMKVSMRGKFGRYLTAVPSGGAGTAERSYGGSGYEDEDDVDSSASSLVSASRFGGGGGAPTNASSVFGSLSTIAGAAGTGVAPSSAAGTGAGASTGTQFSLGAEGQGVGESLDCFVLVNPESREDTSPVRYGQPIALRVQVCSYVSVSVSVPAPRFSRAHASI